MMTSRVPIRGALAAVVIAVASASAAAAQGLYWESTITGVGNETRTSQNYAMPKMMKIVSASGPVVILRADQDKFITVDTKKQTYSELTFSEMESAAKAMQAQMESARGDLEKRMKDMSPEQRAMIEKMLPQIPAADAAKPAAVVVKNTGETKSISGYPCTKYVASADGKTILVAWTSTAVKGFEALRGDWVAYQKRMASTNRAVGTAITDAYAKIEGFPMETEVGNVKTSVTKVEPRTTAASEFDVPPGYKKETMDLTKPPPR